jgi:hypothetical protein
MNYIYEFCLWTMKLYCILLILNFCGLSWFYCGICTYVGKCRYWLYVSISFSFSLIYRSTLSKKKKRKRKKVGFGIATTVCQLCDMVYIFYCMILIFTKVIFRDMLITDFTVHDQIYSSHFDYRYCNMNVDELKRSIFFISFSYYLFFYT